MSSANFPKSASSIATPEAFGEATKTGLGAINNTGLATCTLVGAGLSVYADLSQGRLPEFAGYVALVAWLVSLMLALYLAGRAADTQGFYQSILRGANLARNNIGFTAVVLLITAGAAFTVWSRAVADRGGVIATLVSNIGQLKQDTAEIKAVVTRAIPPAEALTRLGYTTSAEDVCRAIKLGELDALALMVKMGVTSAPMSVPRGGGMYTLCIESLLLAADSHPKLVEIDTILPVLAADLNRLHGSELLGWNAAGPIRLAPLLKAAGVAPAPQALLMDVQASALMFAVWGDNLGALQSLLKLAADPNQGAKLSVLDGINVYSLHLTPLVEARRLGRSNLADVLSTAGGREAVKKGPLL